MEGVLHQIGKSQAGAWKAQAFEQIAPHLAAKKSAPYSPTGPHNFMHNKLVVVDGETVATGSFNFSENATKNAENVLAINDAGLAEKYETYVASLVTKYGR